MNPTLTLSQRIEKYGGDISDDLFNTLKDFFCAQFLSVCPSFHVGGHAEDIEIEVGAIIHDESPFILEGRNVFIARLNTTLERFFSDFKTSFFFSVHDGGECICQILVKTEDETHLIPCNE